VKLGAVFTVRLSVVVAVRLPDAPLIVTTKVPNAAVGLAVNVSVLLEVVGFGLNDAVTPLGKLVADNVTLPVKPLAGITVIALVPWLPCTTVTALGDAPRLKLGAAFTVTLSVVVAVRVPDAPLIVTTKVPNAAVGLAVSVSVLVEVVGFGLNEAVTPVGNPVADNVTLPLKPFAGVTVTVLVP